MWRSLFLALTKRVVQALEGKEPDRVDSGSPPSLPARSQELTSALVLDPAPLPRFMQRKFSTRSKRNLEGIHPDLRRVVERALELSELDFVVTEGKRTMELQERYVREGASRTMKSRHLTGHAIDFVALDGPKVSYEKGCMERVALAFKAAARELKVPVVWGGDWKSFVDTPHVELDKRAYPEEG